MPEQSQFTPQSLLRYTEALRRELYDAVVQLIWTPANPEEHVPTFTPDEAQLTVMYSHGRYADSRIMPSDRHWQAANA